MTQHTASLPLRLAGLRALATASALLVASFAAQAQAFTYEGFRVPGASSTQARDFGPGSSTTGYASFNFIRTEGFVFSSPTEYTTFKVGGSPDSVVYAYDQGLFLGIRGDSGFTMDEQGQVTDINAPNASATYVQGLNAAGKMVGYYFPASGGGGAEQLGFTLENGVYTSVAVPNSFNTEITGINDAGVMVGSYRLNKPNPSGAQPWTGFQYLNGKFKKIKVPGARDTHVTGINNAGTVVGYYNTVAGGGFIGFTYDGKRFENVSPPEATSTYAWHIDEAGRVVGFGFLTGGRQASYVATPVPEASRGR